MITTLHYKIGQRIGDFAITSYDDKKSLYTLKCKCGKTSTGGSDLITTKLANILTEGFTACESCVYNYRLKYKKDYESNSKKWTFKDVHREYVKKSKARNIEFSLSLEDTYLMFSQPCYYCNRPPSNVRTRTSGVKVTYQGLDRIDNEKGYIKDNVVPCCKHCNAFKLDRTQEELYQHVEEIYKKRFND